MKALSALFLATFTLTGWADTLPEINLDDFIAIPGQQEYQGEVRRWVEHKKVSTNRRCEISYTTAPGSEEIYLRLTGISMPILEVDRAGCTSSARAVRGGGMKISYDCQTLRDGGQKGEIELDALNHVVRARISEIAYNGHIGLPDLNNANCRF